MKHKEVIDLAKKNPKAALQIINLFRFKTDREKAIELLKDNGVDLDWAGHQPRDTER